MKHAEELCAEVAAHIDVRGCTGEYRHRTQMVLALAERGEHVDTDELTVLVLEIEMHETAQRQVRALLVVGGHEELARLLDRERMVLTATDPLRHHQVLDHLRSEIDEIIWKD